MFKKRIFSLQTFSADTAVIIRRLPDSINARRKKRISHAFAERLRLATTSVNGCLYCSYGHTRIAMRAGIAREEIDQLLKGEIGKDVDEFEAPGLLFAQHFAETQGHPEPLMLARLSDIYGTEHARDILTYVREIQFGNLSGNTFEAFLSRLQGNAAPGSNPAFEAIFFILSLPVLGPLHNLIRRKLKK